LNEPPTSNTNIEKEKKQKKKSKTQNEVDTEPIQLSTNHENHNQLHSSNKMKEHHDNTEVEPPSSSHIKEENNENTPIQRIEKNNNISRT
jgi:hypothetical protein